MANPEPKAAKAKPPKGGAKGGTRFPQINLKQAVEYAKKLVAKTHTGALPEKTILPGVFGNAGGIGKVRASALKQYDLMEGSAAAYKATQLAKDIDAATEADLPSLLQKAFLHAKVFKQIFDTFAGDTVSRAKIEQRAKGLEVHPTSAEQCAGFFLESAVAAKLGTLTGDSVALVKSEKVAINGEAEPHPGNGSHPGGQNEEAVAASVGATLPEDAKPSSNGNQGEPEDSIPARAGKPAVTLSLTVDATSDPERLEKQLKLLRQYGVI